MNSKLIKMNPIRLLAIVPLVVCFCFCVGAQAAETDNFTGRNTEIASLRDSLPVLDEFVNEQIDRAIKQANEAGSCDRRTLYKTVWESLGRNPIGRTENFAETSERIQSFLVTFDRGVYAGVPTFRERRSSPTFADLFVITGWLSPTIRLNGQIIGTDKLGHFFGQGWEYFLLGNLQTALDFGHQDEAGMNGYIGSGVYSYADLSVNLKGLSFWLGLLSGQAPYVRCEQGGFVRGRTFSWAEYVSPAWDEALNCSKYVSKEMTEAVEGRLRSQGRSCPVAPSVCRELVEAPCSNYTVSPACFHEAGVSLHEKAKECSRVAQEASWNWAATQNTGLSGWDRYEIKIDTILGLIRMPFHFMARGK